MFVVEAYIERTDRFDDETNQFVECAPYYYNPLGTDYCVVISDLKTLRGVLNRITKWVWPKSVVEIRIYSVRNVFDRETYVLEHIKVLKGNKTSIQRLTEQRKKGEMVKCLPSI